MKLPLIAFFCLQLFACRLAAESYSSAPDEIQVLIDVSGSMKQNDPENLRVSATQLLINLLPDKSNVSLWLFAEKTSLLSHTDAVDNNWRQEALKASKEIHSHGIYTHIEDAIQTSLEKGFSGNGNKNLIILTDGMVDISKDIMVSADSRERILSDWIPKLQLQKIKVQTIALSDQVDKELLDKLAFQSGGWSETAESADQLQRLFLRTVQKVAPKNALPLENNVFIVDNSIHEFSLVIFKQSNSTPTEIVGPDQVKLTKNTVSESVSWLGTNNYDLITVTQPTPGEWHIEAVVDPDNQVMILTDLKMQLNEFANFIEEKQSLPLTLHFTERDALITRSDFLALVTISLSLDQQPPINVDANKTKPGFFSHTLENLSLGKHSLVIIADGQTFKREITRDFEVIPAPITVEKLIDNGNRTVTLEFTPDIALLDVSSITITATVHQANREPESRIVKEQNGKWLLPLAAVPEDESLLIDLDIVAKNLDGSIITPALAPITIDKSVFTSPTDADLAEQTAPSPAETDHNTETPISTDQTSDSSSQNTNALGITIGFVLAINLLFCGIGFFVYKMLKKAIAKQQQQLLEKLA
ncbi:VWA domain-containing protein [Methylomonas methanica]|uniref:von Willebrand factor type A n=1 Tax=Methylomonas methanica (strain DSM 25384 / MC09) TaxID=857087 RepID=F9ZWG0_METMM|nr:vWA domain-containing protein [Methylomonas methanica]AEF99629.1 von Willebrand factor type A [Methylomonas methanica MC09]